jgi:hypothetical protein
MDWWLGLEQGLEGLLPRWEGLLQGVLSQGLVDKLLEIGLWTEVGAHLRLSLLETRLIQL